MENETARQDLGYHENIPGSMQKYQINKGLRMQHAPGASPEPSAVCRIRFKNGDIKKLAWEFAEMYVRRGAEIVEWVK